MDCIRYLQIKFNENYYVSLTRNVFEVLIENVCIIKMLRKTLNIIKNQKPINFVCSILILYTIGFLFHQCIKEIKISRRK